MQVAASAVGASGLVAGVDLEPVEPLGQPNVHTVVGDFTDPAVQREVRQLLGGRPVNVILSDMAPSTTGDRWGDHARSIELACGAVGFAAELFAQQRTQQQSEAVVLVKYFQGRDEQDLLTLGKQLFAKQWSIKPKASRTASVERFFLCRGLRIDFEEQGEAEALDQN
mmetsp:Transcript_12770/g.47171  ORF Transcript_12770/g.47171 Transcript_12770/m.47171 type:complete len:168 (-) Transcript_12770:11-514(-)